MATGIYSAGTAFLSVVPSFANVEEALASELRKMGAKLDAQMQASGTNGLRNAGKNASASGKKAAEDYSGAFNKDVNKSLRNAMSDIPVWDGGNNSPWHKSFEAVRKDLHELSNEKIGVTIDENTAFRSIENMRDRLKSLEDTSPTAAGFHDARSARQRLDDVMGTIEDAKQRGAEQGKAYAGEFDRQVKETLGKSSEALRPLTISANTTDADREIGALKARIETLSGKTIGVDISSAEALVEIKAIEEALKALDRDDVDIQVRVDSRAAAAGMQKFREETDGGTNGLSAMEKTADLTMTRLAYLILLGASLGSVFVPAAAAAAGAIGFIGTSAAGAVAGVGVLALGLSGLGTAIGALNKYQQDQGKSTNNINQANRSLAGSTDAVQQAEASLANTRRTVANQQVDAAEKVRSAEQAVASARHDGGIAARDSARQVADAQRDLTRSELDAKDARAALNAAIKTAIDNEHDLTTALDRNQVDQQKAVTAQMKALNDLHALQANPRASEVELRTAKDNYDEQTVRLEELRDKRRDLTAEQDKASKLGVEGDAKVIAARKAVAAADQKVGDNRVKRDREQQDAAERTLQSSQKIADAQGRVADAERDQTRQRQQGQYQIATAMNAVSTAARSQEQATEKMGLAGGTALTNLNNAMAELSPTQQNFARFIFGLKGQFLELRAAAADPMLPGFQKAIEMLLPYLPGVATFIGKIAAQLGSMAVQAAAALQGPVWRQFFSYIAETAVPALQTWFDITDNVIGGLVSLYLALTPFDGQIGRGLVGLSEDFAKWADKLNKTKGYQEFLEYVRQHGPEVVGFLGDVAKLAFRLLEALAPVGVVAMHVLDAIATGLNAIPMPVLTVLVAAVSALALGISGLGFVLKAQKFKEKLGEIFGDSARSAVQKYAIDTGKATAQTGKFKTLLATIGGASGSVRDKVSGLGTSIATTFGNANSGLFGKMAHQSGLLRDEGGKLNTAFAVMGGTAVASAKKLGNMSRSIGGIKSAASGAMSFLGGPWGVALAGATVAVGVLADASAKYNADIQAMADALGQLGDKYAELSKTGKVGSREAVDAINELVDNNPELQESVKLLAGIGVSIDQIGRASAGSKDDIEATMKVLDQQIKIVGDKWQDDSNFLFTVFSKSARADATQLDNLRKLKAALKERADQAGLLAQVQAILNAADERNAAITAIRNAHEKEGAGVVNSLIGAYDAYGTQIDHLNGFLAAFAIGQTDATAKAKALNDVIDDQTKGFQNANEAAETYNAKLLDLKDSIKQNGSSLSKHTRAGLANRDALEAAASAARELTVQDIAAGTPMDQVTEKHNARIKALKAEADKGKLTKTTVAQLVDVYGEIPPDVMTVLQTQNFDKVYNQLALAQFMQQMLAQGKSLDDAKSEWLDKKRIDRMAAAAKKGDWASVGGLATGGPVTGPGTGTSDDVLLWGSDGEHMLTAKEVDAAGGHDAIYAWRKALLAGASLPAFAGGGAVKKKKRAAAKWPMTVNMSFTKIPTEAEIEASAGEAIGGGPLGTADGGIGWAWQESVLRKQFPNIQFTSTTGGGHADDSWHFKGRAVDMIPHTREVMQWIHDVYGKNTLELIGPYNGLDLWHGQPHQYSAALQKQHQNHIHWAFDQGGWLQPGAGQYVNMTGQPEAVLNPSQWSAVEQQSAAMADLVAQANRMGGAGGHTYQFEFQDTTLTAARVRAMQQREDAMNRVGRNR